MVAAKITRDAVVAIMSFVLAASLSSTLIAGETRVVFDVKPVVACHDVTTAEQLNDHPSERLMKVSFRISALVSGDTGGLIEYFYRVDCQHDDVEVVDYEPKTRLASRYEEKITIENKDESSKSIGVNVKSDVTTFASASGGADVGTREHEIVRYALRPPMETVAASGTLARGRSVYFKLRSTPQLTLEGAKEFTVVLRVADDWQADCISLYCEARCRGKKSPFDKSTMRGCASQQFVVSLFEAGNVTAEEVAERLGKAEQRLKYVAVANTKALKKRRFPTVIHRVGATVDLYEPRIPEDWLAQVLVGSSAKTQSLAQQLPPSLRKAATEFWRSKAEVGQLRSRE